MQTLLLPAARSGVAPPAPPYKAAVSKPTPCNFSRPFLRFGNTHYPYSSLSSLKLLKSLSSPYLILNNHSVKTLASPPIAAAYSSPSDESEKAKLAQVSRSLSLSLFVCVIVKTHSLCGSGFGECAYLELLG